GAAGTDQLTGGPGANTCLPGPGGGTSDCPGRSRSDPNDTKGTFDLSHSSVVRARGFTLRLRTFAPWTISGVWDRGFFFVWLDTRGGNGAEYELALRSNFRRLRGLLSRAGSSKPFLALPVTRSDRHPVAGRFRVDRM